MFGGIARAYTKLGKEFASHETLLHWGHEYVNENGFTINNVENFFGHSSAVCAERNVLFSSVKW